MFNLSAEGLGTLAGLVLAAFFAYFPWVKDEYEKFDSRAKPLVNAFVLLLVAWGYLAYHCRFTVDCYSVNIEKLFEVWVMAVVGNIAGYVTYVRQVKQAERAE